MSDADPNEAYDVVPMKDEPHGPKGWWTVTCNGIPLWHCSTQERAQQLATDPAERAARRNVKKLHDR